MIATDHLVFVHLHKSGGTFVNELLLRHGSNARRIGYHLPYREIPDSLGHLPVLGTLRDPLGYYVSWYHFQRNMPRPNALFVIASDGGILDFKKTIGNLLSLERDERRLALLENAVPDEFVSRGLNLTKTCVRRLRGCGRGFYSYLAIRMYAGAENLYLVRTERLRHDLAPLMHFMNAPLGEQAHSFLRDAPSLNASRHGQILDYYDSDLIERIRASDHLLYQKLAILAEAVEIRTQHFSAIGEIGVRGADGSVQPVRS